MHTIGEVLMAKWRCLWRGLVVAGLWSLTLVLAYQRGAQDARSTAIAEVRPEEPETWSQAQEIREQRDQAFIIAHDPGSRAFFASPGVQEFRRAYARKHVQAFVSTKEAVELVVNRTLNSSDWVVSILDPDKRSTSFWAEGQAVGTPVPIRTITPY
jgi:hypothetical protein